MAIPSFSAFHDEGINLEGLLEILSPENNLVLADDMMVSDGNGIILRVSETYEKNFGFAHDSIVGKSAFDLEADGTFTPCITAEVIRRRKKISATQTINHTHKNVMTLMKICIRLRKTKTDITMMNTTIMTIMTRLRLREMMFQPLIK